MKKAVLIFSLIAVLAGCTSQKDNYVDKAQKYMTKMSEYDPKLESIDILSVDSIVDLSEYDAQLTAARSTEEYKQLEPLHERWDEMKRIKERHPYSEQVQIRLNQAEEEYVETAHSVFDPLEKYSESKITHKEVHLKAVMNLESGSKYKESIVVYFDLEGDIDQALMNSIFD